MQHIDELLGETDSFLNEPLVYDVLHRGNVVVERDRITFFALSKATAPRLRVDCKDYVSVTRELFQVLTELD